MDLIRIAELLNPFVVGLSDDQLSSISIYLDILLRWNARMNLSAIRDPDTIVTRHFGESLFAARNLFPNSTEKVHVIDVGSGAGFPGLPIKLWAPNIRLTLIESNQKKAIFLREIVRSLRIEKVEVFAGRAENFHSAADVVILRAVEHFEAILPAATKLVKLNGILSLLISQYQYETNNPRMAIAWQRPIPLPESERRIMVVGSKHSTQQESS